MQHPPRRVCSGEASWTPAGEGSSEGKVRYLKSNQGIRGCQEKETVNDFQKNSLREMNKIKKAWPEMFPRPPQDVKIQGVTVRATRNPMRLIRVEVVNPLRFAERRTLG